MEVRVGHITASCACGSAEFRAPSHAPPYRTSDMMICAACGRTTRYGELLDLIGEQAIGQANRALESLRRDVRNRRRR
jgi:hypothetical protein